MSTLGEGAGGGRADPEVLQEGRGRRRGGAQQRGRAHRQGGDQRLPEAAAVQDRRDGDAEGPTSL